MQTSTGEAGHACQIGDLQRVGGVLGAHSMQRRAGAEYRRCQVLRCSDWPATAPHPVAQSADPRPGCWPARRPVGFAGIQRQPSSVVEQASAGFGMIAQWTQTH
jgi:hypothetical protein